MHVLVTGGAGYIGSHTCKALAQHGMVPVTYDDLSRGYRWAVKWGPFIHGNLSDIDCLRGAIREHRIESVIHFAASAYVGESMRDPLRYFRNNIGGTLSLLEAMALEDVRRIVFSSTCATYGNPIRIPIGEEHPQDPVNPYGESKKSVERILEWCGRDDAPTWVALRYFNAAGCDPDGEIGEKHDPETHIIPLILNSMAIPSHTVRIFGTDYPTPDGTAIRDFIHVSDLADAHVRALRYLMDRSPSRAFNLGTGKGVSLRELLTAAHKVTDIAPNVQFVDRRAGDPAVLVADASAAQKILGWQPRWSGIDDILRTAWSWRTGIGFLK